MPFLTSPAPTVSLKVDPFSPSADYYAVHGRCPTYLLKLFKCSKQCITVHYSILQYITVHYSKLQYIILHSSITSSIIKNTFVFVRSFRDCCSACRGGSFGDIRHFFFSYYFTSDCLGILIDRLIDKALFNS